jgi:hypothetical protein
MCDFTGRCCLQVASVQLGGQGNNRLRREGAALAISMPNFRKRTAS